MIIERITIHNFGSVGLYDAVLNPEINIIETDYISEIAAAVVFFLCSQTGRGIPLGWVHPNTQLAARILLEDCIFDVNATVCQGRLKLAAADTEGNDVTALYRYALSHCPEQDAIEHFDGWDKTVSLRLCWYRNYEDYNTMGDLIGRTNRIAATQAFQAYLSRYIREFQPEQINCDKEYQIALSRQGEFQVFYPGNDEEIFLSETENKLFLYHCFLNVAEFWEGFEKTRDIHYEKKPLIIQNFLEFLDATTNISGLITRTLRLRRQVILFTHSVNDELKMQWNTRVK